MPQAIESRRDRTCYVSVAIAAIRHTIAGLMSLLSQRKGSGPLPRLTGHEVLTSADSNEAKLKGVIFAGRKQFLLNTIEDASFNQLIDSLSPPAASALRTPLASSWYDFGTLVEIDRAMYESLRARYPNILALAGAASAELGVGKVYRSLDSTELLKFLESQAAFHRQFQKFGNVRFERSDQGGRMIYDEYPVYSPYYCASAVGFFLEAILRHGGKDPEVREANCQTLGDTACTFEMSWG